MFFLSTTLLLPAIASFLSISGIPLLDHICCEALSPHGCRDDILRY